MDRGHARFGARRPIGSRRCGPRRETSDHETHTRRAGRFPRVTRLFHRNRRAPHRARRVFARLGASAFQPRACLLERRPPYTPASNRARAPWRLLSLDGPGARLDDLSLQDHGDAQPRDPAHGGHSQPTEARGQPLARARKRCNRRRLQAPALGGQLVGRRSARDGMGRQWPPNRPAADTLPRCRLCEAPRRRPWVRGWRLTLPRATDEHAACPTSAVRGSSQRSAARNTRRSDHFGAHTRALSTKRQPLVPPLLDLSIY